MPQAAVLATEPGRILLAEEWNLFSVNKALIGQACQTPASLFALDNASIVYRRSTHIIQALSRLDPKARSRAHRVMLPHSRVANAHSIPSLLPGAEKYRAKPNGIVHRTHRPCPNRIVMTVTGGIQCQTPSRGTYRMSTVDYYAEAAWLLCLVEDMGFCYNLKTDRNYVIWCPATLAGRSPCFCGLKRALCGSAPGSHFLCVSSTL